MYKTQVELNLHGRVHDKPTVKKDVGGPPSKDFKCMICDRSYTREDHLTKHQKLAHVVLTVMEMKCPTCGNVFEDHKEFYNHKRRQATNSERYKCEICKEIFRSRCEKICHFTAKHNESDFPFKCVCGSAFVARKDLYRHRRNVCTVKPITTKKRVRLHPNDSDADVKVSRRTNLSRGDLRRSSRVRKKKVVIESSEDTDNSSSSDKEDNGEQSEFEGEQAVEIKCENDVWVKEENFSD